MTTNFIYTIVSEIFILVYVHEHLTFVLSLLAVCSRLQARCMGVTWSDMANVHYCVQEMH